jgi:hypothetical protein
MDVFCSEGGTGAGCFKYGCEDTDSVCILSVNYTTLIIIYFNIVGRYPLDKRLGGPRSLSGRCGQEEKLVPADIDLRVDERI